MIRILSPKEFLKAIHSKRIRGDIVRLKILNVSFETADTEMCNALVKTFNKCHLHREPEPISLVYEYSVYQKETMGISGNSILLADLLAKIYRKFNPYATIKLNNSSPCIFVPSDTRIKVVLGIIRPTYLDFREYYRQYLTIAYSIKLLNRLDLELYLKPFKKQNKLIEIPIREYSFFNDLHTGKLARAIRRKEIDLIELNKMTYQDAYRFLKRKFNSIKNLAVETRIKYFYNAFFNENRECVSLKPLFGE